MSDFFNQFFSWEDLRGSFPAVWKGFVLNVKVFMLAEVLVLVWGLAIALARGARGRAATPLRWAAIAYVDFFRGIPAIVLIYIIGFGMPKTSVPLLSSFDIFQLGVLALTLLYGAYVAEVYRAGIESVHWSQTAGARSLGLSQWKTMRFVVLPQAVRRVVPPLLNDFISLQKDSALVGVIGLLEGFRRAQIYSGQHFNATPYVGLALCFIVITIPLTRVTDYLLQRDQERMRAGVDY
jgi:polar amino acid transport system permease protein